MSDRSVAHASKRRMNVKSRNGGNPAGSEEESTTKAQRSRKPSAAAILREERRITKRDAIIRAAASLFLHHGYDGVSLDMILGEVGGSRREIYTMIGNKPQLFVASITMLCEQGTTLLSVPSLDEVGAAPDRVLREFGQSLQKVALTPLSIAMRRLMLSEANRFPEVSLIVWQHGSLPLRGRLARWIERQQKAGIFRQAPPDRLADQFVDMVISNPQWRVALNAPELRPVQAELDAIIDEAVRTFLHGQHA